MPPMVRQIGLVTAVAAVVIGTVVASLAQGPDDPLVPTVDTKPDPEAGVAATDRAGFVRANEPCEPHEPSFGSPATDVGFEAVEVLDGLDAPTVLEFLDPSTAFIGLREGVVVRWDIPSGTTEAVVDLSSETATTNDQGLIGLAVTPDRRHLIVHHTTEEWSQLVAFPLAGSRPDADAGIVLLDVRQPSSQHNGGSIEFDADGHLWASFGDGGGQGDKYANAQDPTTPLGAVLRMAVAVDGPRIEGVEGNPHIDGEGGHPWVFATGIRNPFRFSIDPATGEVWIGDVGQACMEEVSVLDPAADAGANLGWSVYEGTRPFLGELPGGHHEPVFAYWRDGGFCVVIGGQVYRGAAIPELAGTYVFSDLCKGEVLLLDRAAGAATRTDVRVGSPVDIEPDADGELHVVSMNGEIYRLEPTG